MSGIRCLAGLIATALLLSLPPSCPAAAVSLTLEESIKIALQHNPRLEIASQQYNQGEGALTQARAAYLPQLALSGSAGRAHIDGLQPDEDDTVLQSGISAAQLIYDFGKSNGSIAARRFFLASASANLLQVRQNIIFEVKRNYYSVLEKEQLIDVAKQAVTTYEQQLYRAQRYYDAGVRTKIDITNAKVELGNARLELLRARADRQAARVKFEQVLGHVPAGGDYSLWQAPIPLDNLASARPAMPGPLAALLQLASAKRPELQRYASLIDSAEASINQARGEYFPTIQASGSYDTYETDLATLRDQWNVGIGLNWEIFSGFRTDGRVAEARGRMLELEAALEDVKLAVIQDVTDSFLRAEENQGAVELAAQTLTLATENLDLALNRYKAGLNDIIEFNDAQLSYTRSQSNLVSAYYTYLIALARIEFATGTITEGADGTPAQP